MKNKLFELEIKKIMQEYKLLGIEEEWKNELIDANKDSFLKEISTKKPKPEEDSNENTQEDSEEDKKEEENEDSNSEDKEIEEENKEEDKKNEDLPDLEKSQRPKVPEGIKKLFREIVKLTHPDKTLDKKLNDLYIRAKTSIDKLNIYDLLDICDILGIPWAIDSSEKQILEEKLIAKRNQLKAMETSYLWLWIKAGSQEEKDIILNLFIEKNP